MLHRVAALAALVVAAFSSASADLEQTDCGGVDVCDEWSALQTKAEPHRLQSNFFANVLAEAQHEKANPSLIQQGAHRKEPLIALSSDVLQSSFMAHALAEAQQEVGTHDVSDELSALQTKAEAYRSQPAKASEQEESAIMPSEEMMQSDFLKDVLAEAWRKATRDVAQQVAPKKETIIAPPPDMLAEDSRKGSEAAALQPKANGGGVATVKLQSE